MNAKRNRPHKAAEARRSKKTSVGSRNTATRSKAKAAGQVRIIGGQFRRQLVPFIDADGLRPSPDRLRETLFNWIQFELHDAHVLDLCAGSGVLGFEALSRGASWVDFIELQSHQASLISQTAQKLKLSNDNFRLSIGNALDIIPALPSQKPLNSAQNIELPSSDNPSIDGPSIDNNKSDCPSDTFYYHIVFVDPPYDLELWVPMINLLIDNRLVNSQTLFYIEDKRELNQTLEQLSYKYNVLKQTKMGQVFASLLQIEKI
ncbi:RsmD family RNA methyltransferase [Psychrobacter phenylpyruvicus]|uniref:Ribosomal RNA small subunit methyltransferase D n=1 Tax=Psychrobacter phenylpyruvicus TaxID=29432 RepID=A0A379LKX8_9GAMM|nr:RsmD family RNA methyltransferase [Psychrobacter phenylpyruvicus]SUD91236.1 Ribosomal RNA small subunit methyltransferase D [Psychrobacter phenylpyruvicus]